MGYNSIVPPDKIGARRRIPGTDDYEVKVGHGQWAKDEWPLAGHKSPAQVHAEALRRAQKDAEIAEKIGRDLAKRKPQAKGPKLGGGYGDISRS